MQKYVSLPWVNWIIDRNKIQKTLRYLQSAFPGGVAKRRRDFEWQSGGLSDPRRDRAAARQVARSDEWGAF